MISFRINSFSTSIIKSIAFVTLYLGVVYGVNFIFSLLIKNYDVLLEIREDYFLLVDTIIYAFFILLFSFKYKNNFSVRGIKIDFEKTLLVLLIATLYRVVEDPCFRLNIIFDIEDIKHPLGEVFKTSTEAIIVFLNVVVLSAIFEETLFRKIILTYFKKNNLIFGAILSSVLFTSIHINFSNVDFVKIVPIFLFGITAAIIYLRYGLKYSIVYHAGYNTLWFVISLNNQMYWNVLSYLDFGYIYWGFIFASVIVLLLLLYNQIANIFRTR